MMEVSRCTYLGSIILVIDFFFNAFFVAIQTHIFVHLSILV